MGIRTAHRIAVAIIAASMTLMASVETPAKPKKVRFTGKHLFEKRTGLTVLPTDDRSDLALTSIHHHYWVILPYSETWVFETDYDLPLWGNDETYNVSIAVVPKDTDEVADCLRRVLERVQGSNDIELRDPEFLEAFGRPILRYRARPALLSDDDGNMWFWNYWTAAPRESSWYVLHVSTAAMSGTPSHEDDAAVLEMLGMGFGADFDLD